MINWMFNWRRIVKAIVAIALVLSLSVAGGYVYAKSLRLVPEEDFSLALVRDEVFVRTAPNGEIWKMRLLMLLGTDADAIALDGDIALTMAAAGGQCATIEFLLARGADINKMDEFGTPLINAVLTGEEQAVALLLAKGADMHLISDLSGSALECAEYKGYPAIVRLLNETAQRRQATAGTGRP